MASRGDRILPYPRNYGFIPSTCMDPALRLFEVADLEDLQRRFPRVLELIEEWFTHYDAVQPARALGWEDATAAMAAVAKWQLAPTSA